MGLIRLQKLFYPHRVAILFVIHATLFAAAYVFATLLRFDFDIPDDSLKLMWDTLPWVVGIKVICSYLLGSFHGWMRYVTFHDLIVLLRAAVVSSLMVVVCDHFILVREMIPRSIMIFDFVLTVLLIGGFRSAGRLSREQVLPILQLTFLKTHRRPGAIVIGANPRGIYIADQISTSPQSKLRVVGFLDADETMHGRRLGGMLVLGHPDDICEHAEASGAKDVFVLAGELSGKDLRLMIDRCRGAGLKLKVVPNSDEWINGQGFVGPHAFRYRDLDINDLLRRAPVSLDDASVARFVRNKTVMVSGAGGSIGSEICRQLLPYEPRSVLLVERFENNLFQIHRELSDIQSTTEIVPCIADVTDSQRMRALFEQYRPQVVFHAAAHKHVPMMEENPGEAVKNNTFGTKAMADLAHEFGLEGFVLVSTDKAVNPTSVMGVSKQIAERYVHALSQVSSTRFIAVRFGNVLGSVGSVVPIFQQQIRLGGPITVTHPEMRRFFMTIPEASQLVMQAGAMGKGGEIYVLDMGEPIKIVDLARDLIRLSGLSPDDVEIVYSGIRPGEKLFEELYFDDEQTLPTPHEKLRVAYHRPYTMDEVHALFDELQTLTQCDDRFKVIQRLRELIPEFAQNSGALNDPSASHDTTEPVVLGLGMPSDAAKVS
jgi:FlaA1/EpsC-like NDP-sugar epimerase